MVAVLSCLPALTLPLVDDSMTTASAPISSRVEMDGILKYSGISSTIPSNVIKGKPVASWT
jgi:hypothetical protein